MYTDLPEPALREHRSDSMEPSDFDDFWADTISEARAIGGPVRIHAVETGLRTLDVFDVTFPGYGGEDVRAWLRLPAGSTDPLPCVIEYVGYGGGRGLATENLLWASSGFAHLHVDTRGQGSSWSIGDTPDTGVGSPQIPGFMTRGIRSEYDYYYRRVFTDAVRAVDAARSLAAIDPKRIAVLGTSQGGGISLAVAGLVPGLAAVVPFVPFLCDFPRAIGIHDRDPYNEIVRYLAVHRNEVDETLRVLSYFDGVHFARRASAPSWFSAALMDEICKPSTVFAAYNEYAGPKSIDVFRFNNHEGGAGESDRRTIPLLQQALGLTAM